MAKTQKLLKITTSIFKGDNAHVWHATYKLYERLSIIDKYIGGSHCVFSTREKARAYIRNVKSCLSV